jgi:hypothetical protein
LHQEPFSTPYSFPHPSTFRLSDQYAQESSIRVAASTRKVTRDGEGFFKCVNFKSMDYKLLKRSFFSSY